MQCPIPIIHSLHLPPSSRSQHHPSALSHPTTHSSSAPSSSRDNPLHPPLLQPAHLLLERSHLAPAVERPAVVVAQAPYDLGARLLDGRGGLAHDAARSQPRLERAHLGGDLGPGDGVVAVAAVVGPGGGVGGDALDEAGQACVFFGLQAAQLGGDAGLDLGFGELGAGGVGLGEGG